MGLAKKCDWFINGKQFINLTQTETPKYIYLSSRCNDTFVNFMENFFPKLINKYKLIIASEDRTFPTGNGDARINVYGNRQHLIQKLLDKIYVENLDTIHPKIKPIPLGLLVFRTELNRKYLIFLMISISKLIYLGEIPYVFVAIVIEKVNNGKTAKKLIDYV